MQLEKQVCSPEPSKRLRELGVKQESVFSWHETNNGFMLTQEREAWMDNPVSAFTVAELGEMLASTSEEDAELIRDTRIRGGWACDFRSQRTYADTEADARANALIYLLENKLISNE